MSIYVSPCVDRLYIYIYLYLSKYYLFRASVGRHGWAAASVRLTPIGSQAPRSVVLTLRQRIYSTLRKAPEGFGGNCISVSGAISVLRPDAVRTSAQAMCMQ
jgi:hypothetical protein